MLRVGRIIPAYAGSTLGPSLRRSWTRDHPRLRGEHHPAERASRRGAGSSPPTRGAPTSDSERALQGRIIPAYAGSTALSSNFMTSLPDHPRLRGEHAEQPIEIMLDEGSSPPTRGARAFFYTTVTNFRIIPAYAGSTTPQRVTMRGTGDHPRLRGEHARPRSGSARSRGSSPPTRGARHPALPGRRMDRIIPAYAGSTDRLQDRRMGRPDHPRLRGEHSAGRTDALSRFGSSPPTRGARVGHQLRDDRPRIIPAYAGSTTRSCRPSRRQPDHPRLRGEHACWWYAILASFGSSPPTRGALHQARHELPDRGIIPAYAGSTASHVDWRITGRDHPRLRGEHTSSRPAARSVSGSSPPTRGARMRMPPPRGRGQDHPRLRGEHS